MIDLKSKNKKPTASHLRCVLTALVLAVSAVLLPLGTPSKANGWGELIPIGHDCDSWTVTREPTCTESGERTGYCKTCQKDVTEEIPALLHDPSDEYTFDAVYHQKNCKRCGTAVNKEAHSVDENGICSVCKASVSIPGDANGDGKTNSLDVIILKKYLANFDATTGTSSVTVYAGADYNLDGKIDSRDIIAIKKYIANYSN